MKTTSFIKRALTGLVIVGGVAAVVLGGARVVSAQQIDYNDPNNQPITHARFNAYTNVPGGIGNEADFVKLRKSNGDPTVPATQNNFIDPVNDPCAVGSKFDIRTYVHNSANVEYNNNGNGTAVAKDVNVAMQAELGVTKKNFTFTSTISASNAASVTDTGTLNCDNDVQLKLVPTTVKVYTIHGNQWTGAPDSAVNGNLKIGSRVPGSGTVWGCWEDRVIVVYVVEVVKAPEIPKFSCDLLTVVKLGERRYRFDVDYTAENGAEFRDISFDYGDGNTGNENEHTYTEDGTFTVTATVNFNVNGEVKSHTSEACAKKITVTPKNCPVPGKEHLPEGHKDCGEEKVPTELPVTGAGGLVGLFATVSAAGTAAHRYITSRRAV